ncbi:MAG: peptidoglycan-binding protein [Mariprofundus sp.]|nr:peptidoglycan-binding protein [Mariprofundus sp.]
MVEQYGLLEQAMIQAGSKQIITPLPESDPGKSSSAYSNSRLKVIANRLFLLAYLDHDSVPSELDVKYQAAVKAFQRDAFGANSMNADGWVGEKTWLALQEMISFEQPSNLKEWFAEGKPCHALIRAAYLRLYALGLVSRAPGHRKSILTIEILNDALAAFSKVAYVLEWAEAAALNDASLATLELLFDQDEMVSRLASARIPKDVANKKIIKPFIVGMAKIELWLLGYNIRPKGYAGGSANSMQENGLDLKMGSQLFKQLKAYWQGLGIRSEKLNSKSMGLIKSSFPDFFASISERLNATEDNHIPDSEQVYQEIRDRADENESETSIVQQIWHQVYSIGARLWDGIKRVWRWFKAVINKAKIAVKDFVKKISGIAYQYILKAYEAVRAVIKGVTGSISFFFKPVLPLPKEGLNVSTAKVQIGRDKDFDFKVFVDIKDRPDDILKISQYLENKSSLFFHSCRFFGEFLQITIKLLKDIWKFSWISLLMALLRLYKSIKQSAPDLIAFVKEEQRMLNNHSLEANVLVVG